MGNLLKATRAVSRTTLRALAPGATAVLLGLAVGLVGAVVWVLWLSSPVPDSDARLRQDARHAYCRSAGNRARFAEVARNIYPAGQAGKSDRTPRSSSPSPSPSPSASASTVDQGSAGQRFERVCETLVALHAHALLDPKAPSRAGLLLANPGFNLVAGGLLTFLFGRMNARVDRRKSLADALTTAASNYVTSARNYVRVKVAKPSRDDPPATAEIDARRIELWFAIQRQPAAIKDTERDRIWTFLDQVHGKIVGEWADRRAEEQEINRQLDELQLRVGRLDIGLLHRVGTAFRTHPAGGAS